MTGARPAARGRAEKQSRAQELIEMGNVEREMEQMSSGDATLTSGAKRPYTPPTLRHLGSVRELTLGRSGTRNDFGGQQARRSTRAVKTDIAYLDEQQRRAVADQVLGLKLASYEYRPGVDEPRGRHLGFIIEDAPDAPFINAGGKTVDVYAFASAIAAVVQEQAKTIERLERELADLRDQTQTRATIVGPISGVGSGIGTGTDTEVKSS